MWTFKWLKSHCANNLGFIHRGHPCSNNERQEAENNFVDVKMHLTWVHFSGCLWHEKKNLHHNSLILSVHSNSILASHVNMETWYCLHRDGHGHMLVYETLTHGARVLARIPFTCLLDGQINDHFGQAPFFKGWAITLSVQAAQDNLQGTQIK